LECDYASLGKAVARDTINLRRVQTDFPSEESTGGAVLTAYMEGHEPRIIILTFFGELGKAVTKYYLATSRDYVVEREDLRYAAPINIEPQPRVVSRLPIVVYVCEGESQIRADTGDLRRFRSHLDSALAVLHRSVN